MKKAFLNGKIFLLIIFSIYRVSAQDIIILKTGIEIKSRVLEIMPDLVKYKIWENQEGPVYSKNKSDIFMIKYANGVKDVFNSEPIVISNTNQISSINNGSNYLGIWYHKNYNGESNKTLINITKAVDNFLVEYKVFERVDNYFYKSDGSFKEVGHFENGSIVINSILKLSLLDNNTLLLENKEYYRTPKNSLNQSSNTENNITNINSTVDNAYNNSQNLTYNKQNDKNNTDQNEIKITTNYSGHFTNERLNGAYSNLYEVSFKVGKSEPAFWKDIFWRGIKMSLISVEYRGSVNNNEKLSITQNDTLFLDFKTKGLILFQEGQSGKSRAPYLLNIQIEDLDGHEYFSETLKGEYIQTSEEENYTIIPIKIFPDKLHLMPPLKDLFLNFSVSPLNGGVRVLQGFAKFKIVR